MARIHNEAGPEDFPPRRQENKQRRSHNLSLHSAHYDESIN